MSGRAGFYSDYGIGLETVYGTPVAVTNRIDKVTGFTLNPSSEKSDDETLRGTAGRDKRILGLKKILGSMTANGSYAETELLRAMAMGASSVAGTSPYVHTHDPADLLTYSATLVQRLKEASSNEIREFAGCKVSSWKFSAAAGEPFVDEFELVASSISTSSVINTNTEMDAATAFGAGRQVFVPSDVDVRFGDTADALVAGDVINPTSISWTVANNTANEDHGSAGLAEPERDGFRDVTLTLVLPRLSTTQYRTWADANTELQCRILISRGTDSMEVRFPALTLTDPADVVGGAELIRPTLELVAHRAATNNPTWATITEEMQIVTTSQSLLTADLLP